MESTEKPKIPESSGYTYAQEFPTLARIMRLAVAFKKHPSLLQSKQAPEMKVLAAE